MTHPVHQHPHHLHRPTVTSPLWLWLIGVYKLFKAAMMAVAGVVVFRLGDGNAGERLVRAAFRLRLDPDNRFVHEAIERVSGIEPSRLEQIGVGIILYSSLYVVQGVGLVLQKRWAEYFVAVTTGALIPFELYEVARKPTALRFAVLAVNSGILAYLIVRLRDERRARESTAKPPREASS